MISFFYPIRLTLCLTPQIEHFTSQKLEQMNVNKRIALTNLVRVIYVSHFRTDGAIHCQ